MRCPVALVVVAALLGGCKDPPRACGAYDEALAYFEALNAEVLDPSFGDPAFVAAAERFEAVPEGCARRDLGLAVARSIREGQAKRRAEVAARPEVLGRATPERAPQPDAGPEDARSDDDEVRMVVVCEDDGGCAAELDDAPAEPPPPTIPGAKRRPPEPPPKRPRAPRWSYCAYFEPDGNTHVSYCHAVPLAEAQAGCQAEIRAKGIEGRCACTDDQAFIAGRCD